MNKFKILEIISNQIKKPTDKQVQSGRYKKDRISIHGIRIAIENKAGSFRKGKDWQSRMYYDYGYIEGSKGADGDEIDVSLGAEYKTKNPKIFIINQFFNGEFDEHKVMFGFYSKEDATHAYKSGFDYNEDGLNSIKSFSIVEFKKWLKEADKSKPA